MRRMTSFLPGYGVGGAISHWNGQTWRFQTTDYVLRSHLLQRYGRAALPVVFAAQPPYQSEERIDEAGLVAGPGEPRVRLVQLKRLDDNYEWGKKAGETVN